MQAYSVPCFGSVGGCGARAVSRKTPIYFIHIIIFIAVVIIIISIHYYNDQEYVHLPAMIERRFV